MELWRAESDDPEVGGVIVKMPSGTMLSVAWRTGAPIAPTLDAAKQYAAELITALHKRGLGGDIGRTNWASATAAIQRHIDDWNDKLKLHLYAKPDAALVQ